MAKKRLHVRRCDFVPIKSLEHQAALSLYRVRGLLIKQRTQLVNMMRSLLAELGIAILVEIVKALQMAREIVDGEPSFKQLKGPFADLAMRRR